MKKADIRQFIEDHVVDMDISYRGGVLKIDVSELFPEVEEWGESAIMGASQNYLGGGIAGSISNGYMFDAKRLNKKQFALLQKVAEECKRYFYDLNNGGGDEYMQNESGQNYESVQRRAVSGY